VPEPTEQTDDGPDLFEAAVRLREAAATARPAPDLLDPTDGIEMIVYASEVVVSAADLRAILDAPAAHALTDEAVRQAITAQDPRSPLGPRQVKAMRAAIAAALRIEVPDA
jgi:hypothetical protein